MPTIHLLDENTINQIAAGEVIERPSSVVKELVENALDAGATAVTVEIKEGGIALIRVTDNGCGIPEDQVPLAFTRHATSKLYQIDDLVSIHSLGFRGEALASIASVAQVEMITKTADSVLGISYRIEDGKETDRQEIGAPDGTTILVRNLFYHLPARKKFLKSPETEAGYISQLLELLALVRPDVSFRFIKDGQNKLYTAGNGRLKDLIYTVYGREIQSNLIEVDAQSEFLTVSGFIGKPIVSRGNRSFESYFINGRYVKNRIISGAVESAYKSYLMLHRYPFTALHITISPELVDVNVHPAKLEVRFSREQEVYEQLEKIIRNALEGREYIPDAAERKEDRPAPPGKKPEPFEARRRKAEEEILPPPAASSAGKQSTYPERQPWADTRSAGEREEQVRVPQKPFLRGNLSGNAGVAGADGQSSWQKAGAVAEAGKEYTAGQNTPEAEGRYLIRNGSDEGAGIARQNAEGGQESVPQDGPESEEISAARNGQSDFASQDTQDKGESFAPQNGQGEQIEFLSERARKKHRLIGQVFSTYWLLEYDDKLYIMDQHAAHEKVNYERLMADYRAKKPVSQLLSPAMIVSLSAAEELALTRHLEEFEKTGYHIEHYGGREYAISEVPANLYGVDEKDLFIEMLDELEEKGNLPASEAICQKLASMSCKAAIKGGQKISFSEADALIDQLLTLDNPYMCPHGRPTLISMTKTELEKKFKRIV